MAYCSSETDQEHKPLRQPPALLATQPSFTVGANRSVATCAGSGVLWTTITIFVISYVNSSTLSRAPPRLAVEHKVYVVIGSPRQRATRGRVMPTAKLATKLVVESPSSFVRDKKALRSVVSQVVLRSKDGSRATTLIQPFVGAISRVPK